MAFPGREQSPLSTAAFLPPNVAPLESLRGGYTPIEWTRDRGVILPREELVDLILRGNERLAWQASRDDLPYAATRKAEHRVVELFFDVYRQQKGKPGQSLREALMTADTGKPQIDITIDYDKHGNRLAEPLVQPFGLPLSPGIEALRRDSALPRRTEDGLIGQSSRMLPIEPENHRDYVIHWLAYELWEHAGGHPPLTNLVNAFDLLRPNNRIIQFKSPSKTQH
jgi:hypothetical protein